MLSFPRLEDEQRARAAERPGRWQGVSFTSRFGQEWRRKYLLMILFLGAVFVLPGPLAMAFCLLEYYLGTSFDSSGPSGTILLIIVVWILVFVPAALTAITAPRVLAPVALGLIERLDFNFLLFIPIQDEDFSRNRLMEGMAGAPVSDVRINSSLTERIWWLSGQMKPENLLGGIPLALARKWKEYPTSLANVGHPVGRLGSLVLRQWYLYLTNALAAMTCCSSCGCCAVFVIPVFLYRVVLNVHTLAYAAAYYKLLTGGWPWEKGAGRGAPAA